VDSKNVIPASHPQLRIGAWVAAATTAVCLLTAGGSMTTTDAVVAFDLTRSIVEHGSVATSADLLGKDAYRGRDGRYYSPFGLAQSIWNIPFYASARTLARLGTVHAGGSDTLLKAAVTLGTIPAVALLAWAVFALLLSLGAASPNAVVTTLLLVFATPLWPYSKFGFNQPLTGAFLWCAVLAAVHGVRAHQPSLAIAGALAGAALLTRHEMILLAPILAGFVAIDGNGRRRSNVVALCTGFVPFLMAWCAYNWWRFGSPVDTGYLNDPTPEYRSSLVAGSAGLLFSPYSSLLLYCPIALVAPAAFASLWRRDRRAAGLIAAVFVVFFLVYASLGNWMGGRSYGPRYLVPLLPALVIPLAFWRPTARVRMAVLSVIVLSIAVQLPGVLVDYSKVRVARARAGETVAQDTRWSRAPLLLNARAAKESVPSAVVDLVTGRPHPRVAAGSADLNERLAFSPDLWWNYLFYLGLLARAGALGAASALALLGAFAARRAWTLARRLTPSTHTSGK
jgi:hypothetical protein